MDVMGRKLESIVSGYLPSARVLCDMPVPLGIKIGHMRPDLRALTSMGKDESLHSSLSSLWAPSSSRKEEG
jgi:hypothetical protein